MQPTLYSLAFCLSLLLFAGCAPRAAATPQDAPDAMPEAMAPASPQGSYAGEYDITVSDTPAGTVSGTLMLMQEGDDMSGSFMSGGNTTELKSVTKTADGVRISFYSTEYQTDVDMNLKGAPGADELSGMTLGSYKTVAKRKL